MININEYKIAYDDFNNKLGVNNDFQLCTSNLLLLLFLQYIQNLYLEKWKNINIFFIRQNRLKSWNYQIIEGNINNKKIILIDNFIEDISSLYYVEKCLNVIWNNISSVYSIFYNKNFTSSFKYKHYFLYNKNKTIDNILWNQDNCTFIKNLWYSNKQNLYNKVSSIIYKNLFIGYVEEWFIKAYDKDNFSLQWSYHVWNKNINITELLLLWDYIIFWAWDWNVVKMSAIDWIKKDTYFLSDNIIKNITFDIEYNMLIIPISYCSMNNKFSLLFINYDSFEKIHELIFNYEFVNSWLKINSSADFLIGDIQWTIFKINLFNFIVTVFSEKIPNISNDFIYIKENNSVLIWNYSGDIYNINLWNWKLINKKINNFWILSIPLVVNNKIYIWSVDKKVYILDLKLNIIWTINTKWRIFSSPELVWEKIIFWSNDSRIYIYDINDKNLEYIQLWERITKKIIKISNNSIFVQDFNNNLYRILLKN